VRNRRSEEKIKRERTESILKEIIPEAISSLSDERLHGLGVVNVVCSKGRSDAKVYLDPAFVDEDEKSLIVRQLSKASRVIENYCANEQGWFRTPALSFGFDDTLQHETRMDELFKKVEKELHGKD
jgi:ribosome-binding factor A